MASALEGIQRKFLLDAVISGITSAALEGPVRAAPTAFTNAWVELIWGDGEYDEVDIGSQKQVTQLLTIHIYARSREAVDIAWQRLSTIWDTQPFRAAFNVLGGVMVKPRVNSPDYTVAQSFAPHWGVLQLDVVYRYTIA